VIKHRLKVLKTRFKANVVFIWIFERNLNQRFAEILEISYILGCIFKLLDLRIDMLIF